MSTVNRDNGTKMSMCGSCEHDLYYPRVMSNKAENAGHIFCSNTGCKFSRQPHPTTAEVNKGLARA